MMVRTVLLLAFALLLPAAANAQDRPLPGEEFCDEAMGIYLPEPMGKPAANIELANFQTASPDDRCVRNLSYDELMRLHTAIKPLAASAFAESEASFDVMVRYTLTPKDLARFDMQVRDAPAGEKARLTQFHGEAGALQDFHSDSGTVYVVVHYAISPHQQAAAHAAAPDRRIALTIDDLPWQRLGERAEPELAAQHAQLIGALKRADVPVVGFVNEAKLEVEGRVQPARVQMLRDWRDAGFELGNHTFSHVSLHAVSLDAYEQEILRGEATLRPLLAETGQVPRWFRHPYLHAGQSPQTRAELGAFLDAHGYQVAPVTIDNSEWIWAFAYDRVRDTETDPAKREAVLQQLRRGYVPYMLNKLDYYEQRSQQLLGHLPAQVWLIHANALNADALEELVSATRRRGYRFISLESALQDPAYEHADGYNGASGIGWFQRWAMAEKVPKSFYADEPSVPGWVMKLAGREGE